MSKKKFLVTNLIADLQFDCDSLDLILNSHGISSEILSQCPDTENQWVLETNKIHGKQILEKKDHCVHGSHNNVDYWLKFYPVEEDEAEQDPQKQEPTSEASFLRNATNEKRQNSADILVSEDAMPRLPQPIRNYPVRIPDEDQRTLLVGNVPIDFDLTFLKQFLENKKLCNGGNVVKIRRIGKSPEIEVTFEDKTVVDELLKGSYLKLNNLTFEIKQKKKQVDPSMMEASKCHPGKEEMKENKDESLKTIEVHGIPIEMNLEIVKLFFENRKFCSKGKIESVKRDNITLSALVTFSSSKDAILVANQGEYLISGHKCQVNIYRDFEGTCFFLSDLKPDLSDDVIINFLEARTEIGVVNALPTESEYIWMIFTSETANFHQVQELCEINTLPLMSDTYPKVSPVPASNMVLVRDWRSSSDFNEDMILLYFQGCTKNVKSVERYSAESFLVTFHTYADLTTLCKTMHRIRDCYFYVIPYYKTREKCYEEFCFDSFLKLQLVKENKKSAEEFLGRHVKPIWSASSGKSLKFQTVSSREQAEMSLKNLTRNIHEETVEISPVEMRTIDEQLRKETKTANLIAEVDRSSQTLNIVALGQNAISEFKQSFSLPQKFPTGTANTKTMNLESYKIRLLFANDIPKNIRKTYPKININWENNKLYLEGNSSDLSAVEIEILKQLTNIHSTLVPVPENTSCLLDKTEARNYVIGLFKMKNCKVSWKINSKKELTIYSLNDQDLLTAGKILENCVKEFSFKMTDFIRNLIKEKKWQEFLEETQKKYGNLYFFDQNHLRGVTLDRIEKEIKSDFEEFFERNDVAILKETVTLDKRQVEYLKSNKMKDLKDFCQGFGPEDPVEISIQSDDKVDIRASKKNMKAATEFIENFVKTFNEYKMAFDFLGGSMTTHLNSKELKTVFQMDYKCQTMIVREGNITKLHVDAIVNAANKEMTHGGGIAKAIVDAGGQVIQTESTKIVKNLGNTVEVGEAIVTSAGSLPCKHVIHVVGPIWNGGKSNEERLLHNAVKNALKISDEKGITSIAFSAISAGAYKYPLDQALNIMVSTIKKYLDKNLSTHLKTINFVDTRRAVTSEFQEQLCKVLRSETYESEKEKPRKSSSSSKTNPKPNSNPTSQTPTVFVRKGELQKFKADIIVCTISSDFDFKKGVLSNTILQSAGSGLLAECKNAPNLGTFETFVAKGHKLPCSNIIFVSIPFNNDANLFIGCLVEECLNVATSLKATSLAFSSLGTGQAGYSPPEVAKNMLSKTYGFLQQQTSLREISIIIFPKDTAVFKAFQAESKKIPKISGVNLEIEDPGPTSFGKQMNKFCNKK